MKTAILNLFIFADFVLAVIVAVALYRWCKQQINEPFDDDSNR